MTMILATAVRTALATAVLDALDAGSGPGYVEFYTGTKPAGPGTAITTQTKLGTLTLSDPAGAVTSGVLTFSAITQDTSADADGTVTWARFYDSDAVAKADVSVGASGSGADIIMNTVTIVTGGPIQITSMTMTF